MRTDQLTSVPAEAQLGRTSRRFVGIAEKLLEAIHAGEPGPGEKLAPDRELATTFATSRATVREALLALELLGVVEIRHGSGVYVRSVGDSMRRGLVSDWAGTSIRDLFEARSVVEPKIARLCAFRMADEEIQQLESTVRRARRSITGGEDYGQFRELQIEFHRLLSTACRSGLLAEINVHLMSMEEHPLWALLNQHVVRGDDDLLRQVDEHALIVRHIRAGDGHLAADVMRQHVVDLGCALIGNEWISEVRREFSE